MKKNTFPLSIFISFSNESEFSNPVLLKFKWSIACYITVFIFTIFRHRHIGYKFLDHF